MMQIFYLCECINNNSIKLMLQFLKLLVKLQRAHGGYLGTQRR